MVSTVFVVMDPGMGCTEKQLTSDSVFTILRRRYGVKFGLTEVAIGAVGASTEVAPLLGVAVGSPLLSKESLTRTVDGTRRAVTHSFFRGDMYRYVTSTPTT
jgi:DNA-binding GntR family transcriptional regulator